MKPIKKPSKPASLPQVALGVIFRDNADSLPALLESVADHFDEFVFTDTGSVDGSRQIVENFLKSKRGSVTDFEWIDDFSAARNFNIKQAAARWYMFLDSDDKLVNGQVLKNIITRAETEFPHVEGMFIPYDYDVDESLTTMRLCRNNGHWHFEDAIHERLVSHKLGSGDKDPFASVREFGVVHKRKTPEEKKAALYRNARIAEREYPLTTDPAYRARLARTLAMPLKAEGKLREAVPLLLETAEQYPQLPEGKQAYADCARIEASEGNLDLGLEYAKKAGPSYEAILYRAMGRLNDAIQAQTRGSVIPQQTTHEGFLFERAVGPIIQAHCALELGQEPNRVERVLNTVRGDLRTHVAVKDAVMDIRGRLDRITIVVPGTPQPFDGDSVRDGGMLGGSEEAVVHLAAALAQRGRNVRVYGILPPLTVPGTVIDGVEWRHAGEFNPQDEHGTLVIWRAPGLLLQLMGDRHQLTQKKAAGDETAVPFAGIGRTSLWLHDQSWAVPDGADKYVVHGADSIIVLSEFHKQILLGRYFDGKDPGKFLVLSNGIDGDAFRALDWSKRDPNRVVYSSCPSRGLRVLLEQWPKVKAECPEAKLDVYYDWSMLERAQPELYADCVAKLKAVEHLDVKHHGGVSHEELHTALSQANVWAYSHFENTTVETSCISAMKATAAGCTVLTAPNGALPETAPEATFILQEDKDQYWKALVDEIQNPADEATRRAKSDRMLARLSWDSVATRFSKEWTVIRGES